MEGLNHEPCSAEDEAFKELEARLAAADTEKQKQSFTGYEVKVWADGIIVSQMYHFPGEITHVKFATPIAAPIAAPERLLCGYQLTPHVMTLPRGVPDGEPQPEEIED
jgi:hypothetical protein